MIRITTTMTIKGGFMSGATAMRSWLNPGVEQAEKEVLEQAKDILLELSKAIGFMAGRGMTKELRELEHSAGAIFVEARSMAKELGTDAQRHN